MVRLLRPILLVVGLLIAAPAAQAADVDFEPVPLGTEPDAQDVEVFNEGFEEITLGTASIGGLDSSSFSVTANGCLNTTLAPGEGCVISVTFDPREAGPQTGTLLVAIAGETERLRVTLAGEGRESLRVSPAPLDFGTMAAAPLVDPPAVRELLLENVSGRQMSALRAQFGRFNRGFTLASDDCTGATLAPGETCRVRVAFTGHSPGDWSDTLTVLTGTRVVATVSVKAVRLRRSARPPSPPSPPRPRTPDATSALQARLQAAVGAWRKLGAARLRRGGFVVTGLMVPVHGDAHLVVRSGKRIVAKGAKVLVAGKPARLQVRATRFGRKLLADRKARRIEVVLRFVAASDRRVSRVASTVRVPPG
jgi:Abnormal spindle-like microcephaly-assoc'd, ASPM-SPD-2-Hydin